MQGEPNIDSSPIQDNNGKMQQKEINGIYPESEANGFQTFEERPTTSSSNISFQLREQPCNGVNESECRKGIITVNGKHPTSRKPSTQKRLSIKENMITEERRRTRTWSLIALREKFREADIESMYENYWLRLQRHLLFELALIMFMYNVGMLVLYNAIGFVKSDKDRMTMSIVYSISAMLALLITSAAFIRQIYAKIHCILTWLTWLYLTSLITIIVVPRAVSVNFWGHEHIPCAFLVTFAIHTMLPSSRRLSIFFGLVTAVSDLVLVSLFSSTDLGYNNIMQLIANALILLCSNMTGLYLKHFTDIVHRQMFLDTRKFIEANIRNSRHAASQRKLLLKIIPEHLLEDIQKRLEERLEMREPTVRVFGQLLVARHDEASILYADIVSFTPLTANMEPQELVHALNQLFGRFDEIAKENKCMRIKILGDCYYCVSGVPSPLPDHARNCVIMGMQMVKVIEHIRRETDVQTLDMRIGINTGWVLSGVLGTKKWQYDVWSDDVATANHMESGGLPGKIHITRATLDCLDGEFEVIPGNGQDRDELLKENKIETFFISDNEMKNVKIDHILKRKVANDCSSPHPGIASRKQSMVQLVENWGAENPFVSLSHELMEKTLPEKEEVNRGLAKIFELDNANIERNGPVDRSKLLKPFSLSFISAEIEKMYSKRIDYSYKFYVSWAFVIFLFMVAIQLILIRSIYVYITGVICLCGFLVILFLTSVPHTNKKSLLCWRSLKHISVHLTTNTRVKLIMCFTCVAMVLATSSIPVIPYEMSSWYDTPTHSNDTVGEGALGTQTTNSSVNITTQQQEQTQLEPLFATYYIFCCMVTLVACSVFLRVSYLYKSICMLLCLVFFNVMFFYTFEHIFTLYDDLIQNNFISSKVIGCYYTAVLFVMLVTLNRQIESQIKMEYLYHLKCQDNKSKVDLNSTIMEKLLCNILPNHVANHFLDTNRPRQEVYHQDYRNACVIFAAIPNFKVFFSSIDVTGTECLRLLNEIISVFDSLLTEHQNIEKIKTIGSTYMAAAGLVDRDDKQADPEKAAINAESMAKFVKAMVHKLEELNREAFGEYKLRIGMNHGQVLAGVVGAQKPIYDIWGDAVNIASRMESHGVLGKIQVPEQTAALLQKRGVECTLREGGPFKIKGKKDPMNLYFVES